VFFRTICARGDRLAAARALALVAVTAAALLGVPAPVRGCDPCAIYTTTEAREDQTGFRIGLGQQFTYFHTLKNDGVTVPNPDNEKIASSITQLMVGYNIFPRFGLQLNVPIINRSYTRVVASGVQNGDVDGFGDLSLLAIGKLVSWTDLERIAHVVAFAGVKLPSGSSSFLKEEVPPPPCIPFPDPTSCNQRVHVPPDLYPHHGTGPPSGVHGHDLTLGSGSVDGIIGAQLFGSWARWFATASIQYAARSEGAYDYRFANDLLFNVGPGAYLMAGDVLYGAPYALRAQAIFSGETKGTDSIEGIRVGDTGFTGLYLGPYFGFAWGTHLNLELGADLPVLQNTSGLQIVPDYRLRGGIAWRF
jgi:hypothetical protein